MPHEISISDGVQEAMFAERPAWHGLGQVLDNPPSSEAAIRMAHLDWNVELFPLAAVRTIPTPDGPTEHLMPVPNGFGVARMDSKVVLGMVGAGYRPVQNKEAFSFMDELLGTHGVRYESAGALHGGAKVWMLARIPEDVEIAEGDIQHQYMLMSLGHDGNSAVRVLPTSVRVVCQNTLTLALRDGGGVSIRHSGVVADKLLAARNALGMTVASLAKYHTVARRLAEKHVTTVQFKEYAEAVFPPTPREIEKEVEGAQRARILATCFNNFDADARQQMAGVRGTAWAAFNAITQYADHGMRTRAAVGRDPRSLRLESTWFGAGAERKRLALTTAVSMFA